MTETDVHSKVILEKQEAWQTFCCNPVCVCVSKISWCEIISSALLYKNLLNTRQILLGSNAQNRWLMIIPETQNLKLKWKSKIVVWNWN